MCALSAETQLFLAYQGSGELHEGEASILPRLLVFDQADVASRQVSEGRQNVQNSFNRGRGGDVPQNDRCGEQKL